MSSLNTSSPVQHMSAYLWLLVQAKAALAAALKDRYMPSFVGARFSFPAPPDA
jgi:hypothetical protein